MQNQIGKHFLAEVELAIDNQKKTAKIINCNVTNKNEADRPKPVTILSKPGELDIVRYPLAADYGKRKLEQMPQMEEGRYDFRSTDTSALNLSGCWNELLISDFDSKTIWSKQLPSGFNPAFIMKNGTNPGLGIRKLHRQGIDGSGVSVAIIDQPLLIEHREYAGKIKLYEEINSMPDCEAQMHGPAVASLLVGNTVGVAPKADLYYIGGFLFEIGAAKHVTTFEYLAQSIERILQINKQLPKEKKIRVISISRGFSKDIKGIDNLDKALADAKREGIFISSCSQDYVYGNHDIYGLSRDPFLSGDITENYAASHVMKGNLYRIPEMARHMPILLVPEDNRTTASPTGNEDYCYYGLGGLSWTAPWLAGMYALCCQVNPAITPDVFVAKALETGDTIEVNDEGKICKLGVIINPQKLIEKIGR